MKFGGTKSAQPPGFQKSTKIAAKMKIAVRNWTSLEPNEESEMNFAGTQKDLK